MDGGLTRRGFLRVGAGDHGLVLRPPWAQPEPLFQSLCSRCGTCLAACPKRIIVRGDGTYPVVDFKRDGCTFCEKCVDACTEGALSKAVDPPWSLTVTIGAACLDRQGVACRACADFCEPNAIRFKPMTGGRTEVRIETGACTGCGACVSRCPVRVIVLGPERPANRPSAGPNEGAIRADQPLHPL